MKDSSLPIGSFVIFEPNGTHEMFKKYDGSIGQIIAHRRDLTTKDLLMVVEFQEKEDWPTYLGLHSFVLRSTS